MKTIDWGRNITNLKSAYERCESIAKKKNPFLYNVSRFFEDKNKFKAFCSTYASMRIVDDFVDNITHRDNLSIKEKEFYLSEIDKWETQIIDCYNGKEFNNSILLALRDTFRTFDLSVLPWVNLAKAMRWDINNSRFNSFEDFLGYAEGASIAPAMVFISILSAKQNGRDCIYEVKDINPQSYSKDLAIFCYITHILRDISADLELGEAGLVYLPVEELNRFSISEKDLWNFKNTGSINANFQRLMKFQIKRARRFASKGKAIMDRLIKHIDSDCGFILNLLVLLYERTMDKMENVAYNVFNGNHELSYDEIYKATVDSATLNSVDGVKIMKVIANLIDKK